MLQASYAFSLYSPALKDSLQYTQLQIQGLANPLVPLLLLSVLPGLAYDALQRHNRFAPRLILLIGGLVHLLGYLMLWAIGTHKISQPPYWAVVWAEMVALNGAAWTDVACVSAVVRSFPRDRGTVIGFLKSMMGLSASVFATIYTVTLKPHSLSFILVIAGLLPVLVLAAFPFFNAVPFRQRGESPAEGTLWSNGLRFAITYGIIALLSLLMLLVSFLDVSTSKAGRTGVLIGMMALALPLFLLPLGSAGFWARPALEDHALLEGELLRGDQSPLLGSERLEEASDAPQQGGKDAAVPEWPLEFTTKQALLQLNFWLLYFIFGVGCACALLFLNNAGQLVQSLGGPPDSQDAFLALFSVFNCLGRLLFGCLPEYCLHRWGTARSAFLVATATCMAAVTFLTSVAGIPLLYLTSPIAGLAYGAHWSLIPPMASEFFGLGHFGLNYCLLNTSITVMSFVFSNLMGGYVYEARLEQHHDKHNVCLGADCFGPTFIVAASLEVCIVVASVVLHRRTKYIYAQEQHEIKTEAQVVSRFPITGHRLVRQGL